MKNIETLESTALVPIGTTANSSEQRLCAVRADAPFITQLIATAASAPQTRNLRRGTHDDALNSYGFTLAEITQLPAANGTHFSRVA